MRIVVVNYIPLDPPSHIVMADAKRGNIWKYLSTGEYQKCLCNFFCDINEI